MRRSEVSPLGSAGGPVYAKTGVCAVTGGRGGAEPREAEGACASEGTAPGKAPGPAMAEG